MALYSRLMDNLRTSSPRVVLAYSLVRQHKGTMVSIAKLWRDDAGQDIAEYAIMLAVLLVMSIGLVLLIGSNANDVFAKVASSIH